jgi:Ca-activated chloride channel homolog
MVGRVILTFSLLALGLATSGAAQTFRSGIDLVSLGVTVVDRKGNLITDLTEDDFEIYEDGQLQSIKHFKRGDTTEEDYALHIALLLDTSGSMRDDIGMAQTAAIKFLNLLPEAVDITFVDFDSEVRVARYAQADFPRLVQRIRSTKAHGWTALYDALGVYLDGSFYQPGRKVLVLYTDGGDTRSIMPFSGLLPLLRASDVTIYPIGLLDNQPSSAKLEQRMRLTQIAEATAGQAHFPSSIRDLDAVYERIRKEIAAQYTIGYHSTNPARDGGWRKVDIRMVRGDVGNARVRGRAGYFAIYEEGDSR